MNTTAQPEAAVLGSNSDLGVILHNQPPLTRMQISIPADDGAAIDVQAINDDRFEPDIKILIRDHVSSDAAANWLQCLADRIDKVRKEFEQQRSERLSPTEDATRIVAALVVTNSPPDGYRYSTEYLRTLKQLVTFAEHELDESDFPF